MAETFLTKTVNTGSSYSNPGLLEDINGRLYVVADNDEDGNGLWKTEGTEAGTVLVKDILVATGSSNPGSITSLNGIAYFFAENVIVGREL